MTEENNLTRLKRFEFGRWKRLFSGILLLVAGVLTMPGCGILKDDPVSEVEEKKEVVDMTVLKKLEPGSYNQFWQMEDGRVVSFGIHIPEACRLDKPVPMVVFLHFGTRDASKFQGTGMSHLLIKPALEELEAIIVAPDAINNSWVNFRCEESVMAILSELCKTYKIDRKRVLVTGYSMGARGTWHLAGRHPEMFTAAIPMAGRPVDDYLDIKWTVPLLAIHSRSDEVFPFEETRIAVESLETRGDSVKLYALDSISHYEMDKFIDPLKEAVSWVQEVWEWEANQQK